MEMLRCPKTEVLNPLIPIRDAQSNQETYVFFKNLIILNQYTE